MVRLTAASGGGEGRGGQQARKRKSSESDGVGEKRDKDEGEEGHVGGVCEGRSEKEGERGRWKMRAKRQTKSSQPTCHLWFFLPLFRHTHSGEEKKKGKRVGGTSLDSQQSITHGGRAARPVVGGGGFPETPRQQREGGGN